ncbi:Centromere protein like [Actinidia chinensis var. chinensis]|uniref:Centromere protein like n=1 Tax=Actinidia chinensis var. chinensis TaxID=1590841 RepID=A0A2R6R8D1_ACTCC|nr:Centromere protein like [Actinidia chinensis var. chinensis]
MSKRVSFSPDVNEKPPTFRGSGTKGGRNKRKFTRIRSFRLTKNTSFSTVGFLRRIGARIARAMCFVSTRRSSRKVSSSSLMRSRSCAETIDSHRAEAIEDCIEFLYSSSSLQRSNSVSGSSG